MARKKTLNIEVSASFTNLNKIKQELLSLNQTKISPWNSAEIKRVIKEIEDLFQQFPNQKLELTSSGQIREFEKFARTMEHVQTVVSHIKFPEGEVEQQIKQSEEYKKLVEEIKQKQLELNETKAKLHGSQMTKAMKEVFISDYKTKKPEATDEEISKALVEETIKLTKARTEAENSLKSAQKAEKDYVNEQKKALKVAEQIGEQEHSKNIILEESKDAMKGLTAEQKKALEVQKEQQELEKRKTLAANLKDVLGYTAAIQLMRRAYRETINTIKDLDNAFTEMAMVSTLTREEAWKLEGQLFSLADQTGATATEVAQLTTFYLQQGRSLKDAIELTEVAAKSAKVAGIATKEAADLLTTALNGFGMAATEAEAVADKFAKLAAVSATDFEEMATALSKVASQANMAGMSMDFTLGLLAKGIETTRESPESIGTALKTVIARMQELSDYGKTLEEGMDVNRVETMLGNLGIALRDSKGELRSLEEVITELGHSWDDLTKNQKAGIAVALAGTRQQSRLIAMMDDFDRTLELTNEAQQSSGALTAQHAVYMESLQSALTKLQNAYQEFVSSLADNQLLITGVNILQNALSLITSFTNLLGKKFMTTAVAAIFAFSKFNKITSALRDAGESAKGLGNTLKIITGIDFKKTGTKIKDWSLNFLGFGDGKSAKIDKRAIKKRIEELKNEEVKILKEVENKQNQYDTNYKVWFGRTSKWRLSKKEKERRNLEPVLKKELDRSKDKARALQKERIEQEKLLATKSQSVVTGKKEVEGKKQEGNQTQENTVNTKANTKAKIANAAASIALTASIIVLTKLWQNYTDAVNGANAAEALSDMAEFQDKKKSIQDLTKEFKQLNNQALKSVDDFTRMKDIIDEINQTVGDENKLEIKYNLGGEIDMAKTQEQIDNYLKNEEEKQKEKLEKAKKKSQASLGNVAAWAGAGGLAGGAIGATIGTFIGGPAGTIAGAKIGGAIGTAIGTVTGGIINWVKEKKWLKNEENQQLLKDLETYALQEESFYKDLDDKTRQIVDSRVQTAYDLYDFSKGSVQDFEEYAAQAAKDINEIETSKTLTSKLKAYSKAENKDQLKLQYALLDFLDTVANGKNLTAMIEKAVDAAADNVVGGLDLGSIESMQSAISDGLIKAFEEDYKKRNPKTSEKDIEKAIENYQKNGLDSQVASLMGTYISGYERYAKEFESLPERYKGYTNTLTGYLQHLRNTTGENKEVIEAMLDAVANIQSIEQVAQSLTSTMSKITNFNTVLSEIRSGSFDSEKFIDAIGTYNLTPEQIKKLAAGTLSHDDITGIVDKAQEENNNAIIEAINATERKRLEEETELIKMQNRDDEYATWEQKDLDREIRAQEKVIENLKGEIEQYESLQIIMLTQIEIQKRNTEALEEYNKQLENINRLQGLGYSLSEIDLTAFNESARAAETETRNEIQRLVNLAGEGAITFNEEGVPQLNLDNLTEDEIIQVQRYFEAVQQVWAEGMEDQKEALEKNYAALEEEYTKEKEILQERLDAYNDYIDEMERLEKESETNKSREEIAAQLARLGTTTDAESLKRKKELTQQLEELDKAQLESERELTVKGLEDEIKSLDDVINNLPKQMAEAFKEAAKNFGESISESFNKTYIPQFVNGDNEDSSNNTANNNNITNTPNQTIGTQFLMNGVTLTLDNDQTKLLVDLFKSAGFTIAYNG